jgi:hypothetical protein
MWAGGFLIADWEVELKRFEGLNGDLLIDPW